MAPDLGDFYRQARRRITHTVLSLDPSEYWCTLPAAPDWTIHDVIAHLRGIVEDGIAGNMVGAPGDAWTAAQVERGSDADTQVLLEDWDTDAPFMEAALTASGGSGMMASAVFDIHTHELDILGAIGRPLSLPDEAGRWLTVGVAEGLVAGVVERGLPALRVVTVEGDEIGPADAATVLRTSRVELFRSRLGRRSRDQVAAYDWGGADPTPYLEGFAIFGPRDTPLVEVTR
jgi:uncharacterized protein (TIGR03083 family)